MKNLILISLLLSGAASAQTAAEIVAKVDAAQKNVKDVSFKVSGNANFEGGSQKLDLDVQAIPAQSVARVNFNAPDALADNVIVVDKKTVYNYLFLTNQVTVQNTQGAAQSAGFNFDVSSFTNASGLLTSRYNVKLLDTSTQGGAKVYQLEATAKNGGTERNRVWISEQGWRPVRVQLLTSAGRVVTDLTITNYKTNSGLSAAKLKALPKDAEVIRR
jgi:outer membrane lipoprotein-sorting protein